MRPITTISDYRDPSVFHREMQALFHNVWQFAGFARDLASDRDYIVPEIGGKSVVVQNFEGELRAFLNVCSHRYSAIRSESKGNGLLQCPYHGWVYDKAGIPAGIAHLKEFEAMTAERRCELALERWDVETCGELIFVRRSTAGGPSLKIFLGDAWDRVESIATCLGSQIDCNRMTIEANWKVALENTLESYHAPFVHPTSIALLLGQTRETLVEYPHSTWVGEIQPSMKTRLGKLAKHLGLNSRFDAYHHQLVFPALTLATTVGMTYAIQSFKPLSPSRTEFTSFVFAAKIDGSAAKTLMLAEATAVARDYNRVVFEEDRVICEQVQKGIGLAPAHLTGELSGEEHRVERFQAAWKEWLGPN